ncbi:protein NRT1/ PTR FAMILY 1.1-like [Ziziphus jujuba]|uniref:Protein NRT1/ PTR FAMILY 1.1-like n=1 Tax=Ziziphus jujuba TaxID=326968 RepID=A0A6P4B7N2_ZIZJJ|nr:protein NRT1/ PTR FAMILY 1.1-like [Ziziphus jujuba]
MEIPSEGTKTSNKGGFRTMPFIIANESLDKVASFGLMANMVVYIVTEYHLDNAPAINILFLWGAISNFLPIFGAFLSDSFLGRFRSIALGTLVSLLGMFVLWLTSLIPQTRPSECEKPNPADCDPAKRAQLVLLYSSFVLMSLGAAGIRPCSMAFGADQLNNPDNPKNERTLQRFFNWYYASVGISITIAVTIIVYIQDHAGWVVGFGVPVGLMLISAIMFLVGSFLYVKVKANKNLIAGLAHVVVAAWRNKHLSLPPSSNIDSWYSLKGSKLVTPTDKLRFLNKSCMIKSREKDLDPQGLAIDPWSLCTVRQVEELKAVIKVVPIWSTGIVIAVTLSQHSFHVLQARTMDRHFIGKFQIPPGSFGVFSILTLTLWVAIYDLAIVPFLSKFTNEPRGLSFKLRMGIGLAISCLATAVSALVERHRRSVAIREGFSNNPLGVVSMSAMWLIPQNCLTGLGEAFNAIGQIQFYYSQLPKGMASIAVSLFSLGLGLGNVLGSIIVSSMNDVTKENGVSWVSNNLNQGHYDYYYWVITVMSVVNFFYYLVCSWAYGSDENVVWDEDEDLKGEAMIFTKPMESQNIVFST